MDPRIARAVSAIEQDLGQRLKLGALAAQAGLSASRFAALFQLEVGMPPGRFVRARRLDRARALLETTILPVRDIMAAVGITDSGRFARDFRRHYGMRPLEWRAATESVRRQSRRLDDTTDLARLLDEILELL